MIGKPHFLVVEDEENIALAIKAILARHFNGEVDIACNGEEAIQSLSFNRYDLVISDWNMPRKTGDQFLIEMRGQERNREVPFIMLTARSDRSSVMDAIRAGVTDYLHKPFEKKVLIEKIQKLLNNGGDKNDNGDLRAEVDRVVGCVERELEKNTVILPPPPVMYLRMCGMSESFDLGIDDMAVALREDAALCEQMIRLSNTYYYRGIRENSSLEHAVVRVGVDYAKSYALIFGCRGLFNVHFPHFAPYADQLWQQALAVARCSHMLGKRIDFRPLAPLLELGFLYSFGAMWLLHILEQFDGFHAVYNPNLLNGVTQRLQSRLTVTLLERWRAPLWQTRAIAAALPADSAQRPKEYRLVELAYHLVRQSGLAVSPWNGDYSYLACGEQLGLDLQPYLLESLLKDVGQFVRTIKDDDK